jgi:hypothetical protein
MSSLLLCRQALQCAYKCWRSLRSLMVRTATGFWRGRLASMADGVLASFSPCWLVGWSLSIARVSAAAGPASCGPSFQQMAATECQGIATDTAYAECERKLSQELADERLGYIVRSQMSGGRAGGGIR